MDLKNAEHLMAIYERVSGELNNAHDVVVALPEPDRALHMRALGDAMADLWVKLQLPIVREHPQLDPDGDRFLDRAK